MLVGSTNSGKTTIYEVLINALKTLVKNVINNLLKEN